MILFIKFYGLSNYEQFSMHFLHTGSSLPLRQLFLQPSAPVLQYLHLEHMLRPSGQSLQGLQESHPSQDPRQSLQVCEEQELDTDSGKLLIAEGRRDTSVIINSGVIFVKFWVLAACEIFSV